MAHNKVTDKSLNNSLKVYEGPAILVHNNRLYVAMTM